MPTPEQMTSLTCDVDELLNEYAAQNLDLMIPQLARDGGAMRRIESQVQHLPTTHELILGDARLASALPATLMCEHGEVVPKIIGSEGRHHSWWNDDVPRDRPASTHIVTTDARLDTESCRQQFI